MGTMVNRRRVMGNKRLLPDGYTRVEYIENISNAYIDTQFVPKDTPRVVINVSLGSGDTDLFGTANAVPAFIGNINGSYTSNKIDGRYYRYYSTGSQSWSAIGVVGFNTLDCGYEVRVNGNLVRILTRQSFANNTYTLKIFTCRNHKRCKVAWCQCYDGDILYRDFIPCISPDNIVGMYDLVEGKFYSSPNGVAFIAGNPV